MKKKRASKNIARKKNVVVVGGGTGTFTVLTGLKKIKNLNLSAIVSMMDDGGSNRVIRDEFGLLPTSDIRQCIVALSEEKPNDLLRKLFTYRYNAGIGISGMTFGNLFMAALTDIYGSQNLAIKKTCEFLDVKGEIVPVTYDKTHLVARYDNGKQVLGEHEIDEPEVEVFGHSIVELELFPEAKLNVQAKKLIRQADAIIFGPGDLYTSILPNILVKDFASEVKKSKAKKIFIINLMTKHGQTDGFGSKKHLDELEKYLGKGVVDICIVNKNGAIPKEILKRYEQEFASYVKDDFTKAKELKIVRSSVISNSVYEKDKSDKLLRSLIRHDPEKLAKVILKVL